MMPGKFMVWMMLLLCALGTASRSLADETTPSIPPEKSVEAVKAPNSPTEITPSTESKSPDQKIILPLLCITALTLVFAALILWKSFTQKSSGDNSELLKKLEDNSAKTVQELKEFRVTINKLNSELPAKAQAKAIGNGDYSGLKEAFLAHTIENKIQSETTQKELQNNLRTFYEKLREKVLSISGEALKERTNEFAGVVVQLQKITAKTESTYDSWNDKVRAAGELVAQQEAANTKIKADQQSLKLQREALDQDRARVAALESQLKDAELKLQHSKEKLATDKAMLEEQRADHDKTMNALGEKRVDIERQTLELARLRQEQWPAPFRDGAPMQQARAELEAAGHDSAITQLLLLSVARMQPLLRMNGTEKPAPTADKLDEALRYMGNQLYLFGEARNYSQLDMQQLAERWAQSLNPLLGEQFKIEVVEPGSRKNPQFMSNANSNNDPMVKSVHGWIILNSSGNAIHRAPVL